LCGTTLITLLHYYFTRLPMRLFFPLLLLLFSLSLSAQQEKKPLTLGKWEITPILGFQGWATYTHGTKEYDTALGQYIDVDDRLNFLVRRLRWGSTAKMGDRLLVKFVGAVDWLAEDQRSGPVGGVNFGAFPPAQVWDIYAQYKLTPNSEGLYVIGGYLRPPVGRESISGAFGVSSFEKSFSQWYLRTHLVGTGPGAAGGMYFGGLQHLSDKVHLDYRGGVFNPQNNGISAGRLASPLFTARVSMALGDAERETWAHGLPAANAFGKRNTVALALSLASEGPTDAAPGGVNVLGVDGVITQGQFHLEGEYHLMGRKAPGTPDLTNVTYLLRGGFNIDLTPTAPVSEKRYLEPSLLVYGYNGTLDLEEYETVLAASSFGGEEQVINVGLNYHLRPGKVRLGLHYTAFTGERGDLPPAGRLSQFWQQPGIGGIQRGNYAGLEIILIY
ncbi:MAG: hypothetical protein AAF840_08650, partial [Bacteroidota bacterium]